MIMMIVLPSPPEITFQITERFTSKFLEFRGRAGVTQVHHEALDRALWTRVSNGEMEVSVMASVTPLPLLVSLS